MPIEPILHFFESQTCHLVETFLSEVEAGLKQDVIVYNLGGDDGETTITLSSSESELATEYIRISKTVPTVLRLQDVSGSIANYLARKVRTPLLEVTLPPGLSTLLSCICCGVSELDPNLLFLYSDKAKQIKGIFERKTTNDPEWEGVESDLPDNPDQLLGECMFRLLEIRNDIWQEHIRTRYLTEEHGFRNHRGIYIA
ncbi:hypothetical protein SPFM10_00099 [Salmonella phage SPFM10]|nr:hypothetical protein SPFM10_00099 [Salmonella phage SPFM10]